MKIGVVIDRLNFGGVEKIAIEQVLALRKLGEDAELVVLREKAVVSNAFPDLIKQVPVTYLDRRLPSFFRLSFPFPLLHFFSSFHVTYPFLLPFVVKRNEYDYFIVHSSYTCFSAISLKKTRGIKFSGFIWDPSSYIMERVYSSSILAPLFWVMKKAAYAVDKFVIKNMDMVLAGGAAHNEFIHKVDPNKTLKVIYPSVHPIKKPVKKDDYVLMVTAWKEGKNPEYLVELLKELPGLHIKMAGKWLDPSYRSSFEKLLKDNKLTRQVELVGEVTEAQLATLYSKATVILQTNDDRGFGMSALEAAGRGTTFIIPEGQGVGALFTDKKEGFYTKERDTKAIAKLLKKFAEDKKLAIEMGNTAWRKVTENYSWERHAEELKSVVKSQLKG